MFNRHRTNPDSTRRAPARDDRHAVALRERTDAPAFDAGAVRARLAASASVGLRDRLARTALSTLALAAAGWAGGPGNVLISAGPAAYRASMTTEAGRRRPRRQSGVISQLPWRTVSNPYPPVEILSADEVETLHRAALRILAEIGVEVLGDRAIDLSPAPVRPSTARPVASALTWPRSRN